MRQALAWGGGLFGPGMDRGRGRSTTVGDGRRQWGAGPGRSCSSASPSRRHRSDRARSPGTRYAAAIVDAAAASIVDTDAFASAGLSAVAAGLATFVTAAAAGFAASAQPLATEAGAAGCSDGQSVAAVSPGATVRRRCDGRGQLRSSGAGGIGCAT